MAAARLEFALDFRKGRRTPKARGAVAAGTGQKGPVSGKRQSIDWSGVPAQGSGLLKRSQIPEFDRGIVATGGQSATIRRKGQGPGRAAVSPERLDLLERVVEIPKANSAIPTRAGQPMAVGREPDTPDALPT